MAHPRSWIVPGGLLLLAAGFLSLGRWQLERAEVNRAVEERFDAADRMSPLVRPPVGAEADAQRYRKLSVSGRYEPGVQILLDNMTRDGRVGYEVLTPFAVEGLDRLVVVNRGWVPAAPSRDELPDVAISGEPTMLQGRIDRLPRAGLALGDEPEPAARPVVVMSFPGFDDLETVLGRKVFPFQLRLDADADAAFVREWTVPRDLDERNIAYAVQWFALAGLSFVLATGVAIRSRRRSRVAP